MTPRPYPGGPVQDPDATEPHEDPDQDQDQDQDQEDDGAVDES